MAIQDLYLSGQFSGWLGEEEADKAWNVLQHSPSFVKLPSFSAAELTLEFFLHRVARKAIGKDIGGGVQLVGSCVSWGAKHATEYLSCADILLREQAEAFKNVFSPYYYGTGRVFVGGGRFDGQDGSLGSWQAEAVMKYGTLFVDEPGVPPLTARVEKEWGDRPGPKKEFVEIAKKYLVRSAAKVTTWDELCLALSNGYAVTVASNQGFEMTAGGDGFHDARGSWAHQMCIFGYSNSYKYPYGLICNSWGDVHGRLKDFETGEDLPVGTLRVHKSVIEKMLRQGDSFAFSQFDGFPSNDLPKKLFYMS